VENLKTLIDKASDVCGSDKALAERMGVKPNVISMLRHGRPITPETAAELAAIAGEDAVQALVDAVLLRAKGTRREGVLREVLGKALAAGVAGLCLFSYSGDSISATENRTIVNKSVNLIYIVECLSVLRKTVTHVWRAIMGSAHTRTAAYQGLVFGGSGGATSSGCFVLPCIHRRTSASPA
jgi:transcriptional regulator with XRE-family HTH domain